MTRLAAPDAWLPLWWGCVTECFQPAIGDDVVCFAAGTEFSVSVWRACSEVGFVGAVAAWVVSLAMATAVAALAFALALAVSSAFASLTLASLTTTLASSFASTFAFSFGALSLHMSCFSAVVACGTGAVC